jgi:phosphoglycolate phosphatase-like HAD superfamily hydrolase
VGVRCVWMQTRLADAQINSIRRMIEVHGALPTPEEIKVRAKNDPRFLLPDAQFRYERVLEPPTLDEGFESVDVVEFERAAPTATNRALILDASTALPDWHAMLDEYRAKGWLVMVYAWLPSAALPDLGPVDTAVCTHEAGPPVCWCRKPIPGSVIAFAMRRDVDLTRSIVVGNSAADRTMAERIGARYVLPEALSFRDA